MAQRTAVAIFAVLLGICVAMRRTSLGDLQVDGQDEGAHTVAANGSAGTKKCCAKCMQNAGCLECKKTYLGYTLELNGGTLPAGTGDPLEQFVMTTKKGQKIKIALPQQKFKGEGGSKNCFAYATRQSYQIPAQSPSLVAKYGDSPILKPHEVSDEGLHVAMEREEAIFIGRTSGMLKDTLSKKLPLVDGRSYYIVAVFVTPGEEYHFWGLWNNGWYCVSSKISAVAQDLGYFSDNSKQCPMGSVFTMMKAKNPKYNPDMGGFWLFPCRTESCW